jgi:polysaccharide pyruvyl transferase WcaK-like protein
VGYVSWAGHGNLGDDVMLSAAQDLLAPCALDTFGGARREAWLARLGLSGPRRLSHVILGGGTLLNSGYLQTIQGAQDRGIPVTVLGTGVGRPAFGQERSFAADWADVLQKCRAVGVRGPRSLAALQAAGISGAEVVGDLALTLAPDVPLRLTNNGAFLVNLAGLEGYPQALGEAIVSELTSTCRKLVSHGLRPIPVAFAAVDVRPLETLMGDLGTPRAIARPTDFSSFRALAAQARLAVGVRLHCSVLSSCLGLPFLAIAYGEKVRDFADSMGVMHLTADPLRLAGEDLPERALALADEPSPVGTQLHARARAWRDRIRAFAGGIRLRHAASHVARQGAFG